MDAPPSPHTRLLKAEKTHEVSAPLFNSMVEFRYMLNKHFLPANSSETEGQRAESSDEKDVSKLQCCPEWKANIDRVLFTESAIQTRIRALATTISEDYKGKEIVAVGLLKGAVCFMIDLLKYLTVPYTMDFMALSSYGKGTKSKGSVVMKKDLSEDPAGKHILIVEDIIDTGGTLRWLKKYLADKNCASIRIACLLDKKARRSAENEDIVIDYPGFHCPDKFVIGYGLDFAGHYRCLPFIGVLKPGSVRRWRRGVKKSSSQL